MSLLQQVEFTYISYLISHKTFISQSRLQYFFRMFIILSLIKILQIKYLSLSNLSDNKVKNAHISILGNVLYLQKKMFHSKHQSTINFVNIIDVKLTKYYTYPIKSYWKIKPRYKYFFNCTPYFFNISTFKNKIMNFNFFCTKIIFYFDK